MRSQKISLEEQMRVVERINELKIAAIAVQTLSRKLSMDQIEQEARDALALYDKLRNALSGVQQLLKDSERRDPGLFQRAKVVLPSSAFEAPGESTSIDALREFLKCIDEIKAKGFQKPFHAYFELMGPVGLMVQSIAQFIHGLYQKRSDLAIDELERVMMVLLQNFNLSNIKNPSLAQLRDYVAMFELSEDVIANRLSCLIIAGKEPLTAEDIRWCVAYRQEKFGPNLAVIINKIIALHVFFISSANQEEMTLSNIDSWALSVDSQRASDFFLMMEKFNEVEKSSAAKSSADNKARSDLKGSGSQMRRGPGGL